MLLRLLLLVSLALVVPCLGARLPYIIGGSAVDSATRWPWQCSLGNNEVGHYCGAAIINEYWLVTAAHCIDTPGENWIRCGTINRTSGITTPVRRVIQHERYNEGAGTLPNDITVMQVDKMTFSDTVKAIRLASFDQDGNEDCYITGWGYIQGSRDLPVILQEAKVNVYTNYFCKLTGWGDRINDGHVCTGDTGIGSCNGDSGGPLVCKVGSSYQLVGVTSWGLADCHPRELSVYTRMSYFGDWVRTNTGV